MANLLTTCATSYGSSTLCWSSGDIKAANFWVCSGSDSYSLGQGSGILDIWISDSSISHQPRSIFRAYNQGNCIILGQGCSANTNATIPVYACNCLQSPIVCATGCVQSNTICGTGSVGEHGALEIKGSKNSYGGVQACCWTWMTNTGASGVTGFYDDSNCKWGLYTRRSCETRLFWCGEDRFYTTSYGTCSTGIACAATCFKSPRICASTCVETIHFVANTSIGIGRTASSTYPLMLKGNTRYQLALCNSGSGDSDYPWFVHDNDNVVIHFNGVGDRYCFHNSGAFCATSCVKTTRVCSLTAACVCACAYSQGSIVVGTGTATTCVGAFGGWYDIAELTEWNTPAHWSIKTCAHNTLTFTTTMGYHGSNTASINVLNSSYTANSCYIHVNCIRIACQANSTYRLQLYLCRTSATGCLGAVYVTVHNLNQAWIHGTSMNVSLCACLCPGVSCNTITSQLACSNTHRMSCSLSVCGSVTTGTLCGTTCARSATVCGTTLVRSPTICGTTAVNTDAICVASVGSISGDTDYEGLAIGQAYSNEGGWNTQLNMYGRYHDILRIKKCAGSTTDNAQCLSLWVHDGQAATIQSTGNLLLKAGSAMSMCLKNGLACTPILCATTCVYSNCLYANNINADVSVTTPIIAGTGSAASDYGAVQVTGAKNNWGGMHTCGFTFMACCDCSTVGIYNDSTNEWVFKGISNSSSYMYYNGTVKGQALCRGFRACGQTTGCGYLDLCPNGSWGHLITDRSKFYANKPWIVDTGCVGSYDEDLTLHRGQANGTAGERIVITSGTTHICQCTKVHGIAEAAKVHICAAHNCLHMASICDSTNYNFTICSMYNWANSLAITNRCIPILKACFGNCVTSLWGNNTERICLHPTGTKIIGNLCVTGTVTADGMEGDTLSCATVCTGTICFNTSCATGLDAVYDIYVSSNPNCGGSASYRDIVHLTSYVTTGWSGSAVTKYINTINKFSRNDLHGSGGGEVTATAKLLVGTVGADSYAAACATCLQVQVSGGSSKDNTCVIIKKVL